MLVSGIVYLKIKPYQLIPTTSQEVNYIKLIFPALRLVVNTGGDLRYATQS